ncbi:MAG: Rrf2 family transcriptional regulator, partial [Acidobacteriota bacterium]
MAANSQFSMAIHLLSMLARSGGSYVKSGQIAKSINTNPVVVRRLLSQLNSASLIQSQTGAGGGSRLTRAASEIALADVYNAVSCGEVFALHPRSPDQDCPVGKNIEVVESILDALDKPHSLIKYVKDRLGHDRRYAIDSS